MWDVRCLAFISITGLLISCASQPRTKWTDPVMRVMVDPDSISADHHAMIQSALARRSKFVLVDRAQGYRAMKKEQERQHRVESDRFEDREKWAHWGKMYGVRGIVVAHAQCRKYQGFIWGRWYNSCRQFLSVVDALNGEIICAVEGENETADSELSPDWNDIVAKLEESYPTDFLLKTSPRLENYRAISAEEAQRQREIIDSNKIKNEITVEESEEE